MPPELKLKYPRPFNKLLAPSRYKCAYGGRESAKSWTFAKFLIVRSMQKKHLILCCREFQNSILDSVHRLLVNQIHMLGFDRFFRVNDTSIVCLLNGSEFIFKGLHRTIQEIKSLEGVTIAWVEEARSVTKESLRILLPTIRVPGSEIWFSFNTELEDDPVYEFLVKHPPDNCITVKVGWQDNPWFSEDQNKLRLHMQATDPDAYDWVWEGQPRKINEASIFKGNFVIEPFEEPEVVDRFFFGADFGFSQDPTVLIRAFIKDETLFVDHEAYGMQVDLDDVPLLFAGGESPKSGRYFHGIPGAWDWPIKADSSQPQQISYLEGKGFRISAAEKWPGSVEDGIAHLKAFKKIVIHERCVNFGQEARLYSFKVDSRKDPPDILPKIEDRHNNGWDSLRYSLDGYIQSRGDQGIWEKLSLPMIPFYPQW